MSNHPKKGKPIKSITLAVVLEIYALKFFIFVKNGRDRQFLSSAILITGGPILMKLMSLER